jgi:hypothetical protein
MYIHLYVYHERTGQGVYVYICAHLIYVYIRRVYIFICVS